MIGYLMAGIGALLSAILHKLASLFILYGNDLVTIYVNLFDFLKKQLHLENASPQDLIIGILVVYVVLGSVAAITGYFLGRYSVRTHQQSAPITVPNDQDASSWKRTTPDQKFRIGFFYLHILMIPVLLLLFNRYSLHFISLIPAGIYIVFLLSYYKRILGRLKKPFFWTQLILMTVVAGLFWNPSDSIEFKMNNGFLVGLEMSIRAVLIVSAFSALSVEIRNPRITETLLRIGFGNAYAALSLSFNSLPAMLDRSSDLKSFVKKPMQSFTDMIYEAELWLQWYQTDLRK